MPPSHNCVQFVPFCLGHRKESGSTLKNSDWIHGPLEETAEDNGERVAKNQLGSDKRHISGTSKPFFD